MNKNGIPRGKQPRFDLRTGEWLSSGEASRMIGVDRRTLRGYEDKELITAHKTPGGHRRYRKSDVDALLRTLRGNK